MSTWEALVAADRVGPAEIRDRAPVAAGIYAIWIRDSGALVYVGIAGRSLGAGTVANRLADHYFGYTESVKGRLWPFIAKEVSERYPRAPELVASRRYAETRYVDTWLGTRTVASWLEMPYAEAQMLEAAVITGAHGERPWLNWSHADQRALIRDLANEPGCEVWQSALGLGGSLAAPPDRPA